MYQVILPREASEKEQTRPLIQAMFATLWQLLCHRNGDDYHVSNAVQVVVVNGALYTGGPVTQCFDTHDASNIGVNSRAIGH